jgi:uncharacterized protein (DUF1684 family)
VAVTTYEADIEAWRAHMSESLRSETGWLTLIGLYWLHEGTNTIGSDPSAEILLPEGALQSLGTIEFHDNAATLHVSMDTPVLVNGERAATIVLRDDSDPRGASRVEIGSLLFTVIQRGDQYGIRLRDRNHPARQHFKGRIWYPIDPNYRVRGIYIQHPEPRMLQIMSVAGVITPISNPGYVEFALNGQHIRLEAFNEGGDDLWFVFRDANPLVYRASRFMYAPITPDGSAILDFNKAYNPPCAFTPYATCPLPLKENILSISIEAGEKAPQETQP